MTGSCIRSEISEVHQRSGEISALIRNHGESTIQAHVNGKVHPIAAGGRQTVVIPSGGTALSAMKLRVEAADLPAIERKIWVYRKGPFH